MARNSNASYESGDNRRIPLSGVDTSLSGKSFATLDEFVRATDSIALQRNRGYSFHFCDTGGWCPLGTANQWYRCMVVRYQNPIGTAYSVGGTVILAAADGCRLYYGYINGTTSFTVEWTSIKDDGTIRAAVPRTTGMLNGHIIAGTTGWTGITSHANGDLTNLYRVQLNNSGTLTYYTSSDGGSTWTAHGNYVRTDHVTNWISKSITANTNYMNNVGYSNCYYNAALKLATASINCGINPVAPNSAVLASGFPKAVATRATFCISQGTATAPAARVYINQSGQLIADGGVPSTGWYNGSVTYPYSSL